MGGTMLSVKGIYEDGQVKLLEKIPQTKRAKVIVTVLEDELSEEDIDVSLFDDIVGAVSIREDGSVNHDEYVSMGNR